MVSETVATPLEQQINGVENMLYMNSQATGDGNLHAHRHLHARHQPRYRAGAGRRTASSIAQPQLPDEVQRLGVTVKKNSPDMLMVIHLSSPDGSRDQLYISNYATLQVKDVLARLDGVGDVQIFGARDYAMRIWLDPDKVAARNLTAGEVVAALQAQNVQVAVGRAQPAADADARAPSSSTSRRWAGSTDPRAVRQHHRQDRRRTGASRASATSAASSSAPRTTAPTAISTSAQAVPLLIFQRPGSNALATADRIKATMRGAVAAAFPSGLQYDIVYNPTEFIAESVHEVQKTIFEAVVLVVIVVILFLQTWRASIIPIVAIPVSLIGTFAVLAAFGFSLNNLSLFGLVLAIGIVVDDAIVVVENVERNLRARHEPARGGAPHDGRGRRRADRHRAGAVRGLRSGGLHPAASPASSSASSR